MTRLTAIEESILRRLASGAILALATQPANLWACAACYGQSDSAMAKGLNWGIFSLLMVVVVVLGSLASFFVFLGRKSASLPAAETSAPIAPSNKI